VGNLPPVLLINGFKLISPVGSVTRTINLARNYWDREYVAGYESISRWAGGFLPYPAESFRQFATEFVAEDRLKQGSLVIDGIAIRLENIACPVLAFVGTTDKVAPPGSVDAIGKLASSADVTTLYVPLGHIGMVAGSQAPSLVWEPMAAWLLERSGAERSRQ
jgi:polyhydroxyalkanoate synthase